MNLKATILLLLFTFACAAPSAAQAKKKKEAAARPDFSGTWVLDSNKSRYSRRGSHGPAAQPKLVISQGESEVRARRTLVLADGAERAQDIVYYTDGRGEKNAIVGRDRVSLGGTNETVTKWKGARLFIRGTAHLVAFGDVTDVNFTEEWELSADGKTLTLTTEYDLTPDTNSAPGDPRPASAGRRRAGDSVTVLPSDSKRVYNRAP